MINCFLQLFFVVMHITFRKKRSMSRKACVTADEIFEAVKDSDYFINSTDILKSRSDPIWIETRHRLNDEIQITNLYLYLKQNRNNVRSRILEYKGIAIKQVEDSLISSNASVKARRIIASHREPRAMGSRL